MKPRSSGRKIDAQPRSPQNVATDNDIVWFPKEWQSNDFRFKLQSAEAQTDAVEGDDDWFASCLSEESVVAVRSQGKPPRYLGTDTGAMRSRVDLCQHDNRVGLDKRNGSNANLESWSVLSKVIDGLAKADLGPAGFFVVCHRDRS